MNLFELSHIGIQDILNHITNTTAANFADYANLFLPIACLRLRLLL